MAFVAASVVALAADGVAATDVVAVVAVVVAAADCPTPNALSAAIMAFASVTFLGASSSEVTGAFEATAADLAVCD